VDGKWLDNSDGRAYCGGECVFKVWDFSSLDHFFQFKYYELFNDYNT